MVFDYDTAYLADRRSYSLSPDLPLASSRHSLARLPGCFADSAPDRWGRNLIAKRIRAQSRAERRQPGSLQEVDYLLGVSDVTRQGALRFGLADPGPFLDPNPGVPKLLALPRLLQAADAVAAGGRSVLLLERFDRSTRGRIGYLSAMTLLGVSDGDQADYLEIAESLSEHGSNVSVDLAELWRRIAFSLIVNNTDDHLRNHGFLRETAGWRLSPAFDINPDPDPASSRATTIGFLSEAVPARAALVESAADFGLDGAAAESVWEQIVAATASWREVATANGITQSSCDRLAPALDRFRT